MKIRLVIAFVAMCCVFSGGQEKRQTPSGATVTVIDPKVYKPGDTLKFIVRLTPAPNGYGGGEVTTMIVASEESTQAGSPEQTRLGASKTSQDGVSEYVFQFPIAPYLKSGEWKVAWVQFGRASGTRIAVLDHNSFHIDTDEPPISITLSGPKTVENGIKAKFHVSIDKSSVLDLASPCEDALYVSFHSESDSMHHEDQGQAITLKPNTLSYDVPFERLPDAQRTGKWVAELRAGKNSFKVQCGKPRTLVGQTTLPFEVVPATKLVVPITAQVTLNPSEIELLQVQASSLRAKVAGLKGKLSEGDQQQNRQLLQQSLAEALQSLADTEDAYKKQAKVQDSASGIFFDDLRRQYHDILISLSAQAMRGHPSLVYISAQPAQIDSLASGVLAVMDHNINAYEAVANAKRWVFTLKLRTEPAGAKILYCRKPDPFVPFDQATNSNIENLPIAIWFVRFQKDGYKDEEVRYDATTETDPVYKKLSKLSRRSKR